MYMNRRVDKFRRRSRMVRGTISPGEIIPQGTILLRLPNHHDSDICCLLPPGLDPANLSTFPAVAAEALPPP